MEMELGNLQLVADVKTTLGEGPVWDGSEQCLYWVDILEKRIYRMGEGGTDISSEQVDSYVGAAVRRDKGGFVLATQKGFCFYDDQTHTLTPIEDPERNLPDNRFNDGKCDPAGRFIAGTMSMTDRKNAGALYRLDTDLRVHKLVEGVSTSNGLAWSSDGGTMYYTDTPTRCVVAYAYDLDTGRIGEPQEIVRIPDGQGYPDGMTIDAEDCLWIAHWDGGMVTRWDPRNGKQLDSIQVPAQRVTSCTFGGTGNDELFITTARVGLDERQLAKYPLSGGIFKIKTSVQGGKTFTFKG